MLRSCLLLACALALGAAATVDHNRPGRYNVAEERDGAHHAPAASGGSSYSAPAAHAAPAPASSYSAPTGGSTDNGGVYYYYYPTEEQGGHDLAGGFDVFTSLILPLVILGGLLLALSSLTFTFTGRSIDAEPGLVDQLESEVERLFNLYLTAMDTKACKQRVFCQTGVYSKSQSYGDQFLDFVEAIIPSTMKGNMNVFKAAAKKESKMADCMRYKCKLPKLFGTPNKN